MGALTAPQITAAPGSYVVTWALVDAEISLEADRLRSHTDGRVQARVRVTAALLDGQKLVLHHGMLNLAAGRSRRELSRDLEGRLPRDSINWDQIVEESCRLILEREEQGTPAERLEPVVNVEVEYLLRPLLLDHLPVVWYAPGGSGKSLVGMYAALLVQNGLPFLGEPTRQTNVLYLDWEVTREEAARRCTLIAGGLSRGISAGDVRFPLYRRCMASIQDEASEIAKDIAKHKAGLVIVDSAGPACGGDVMSGELAIQLFNTLRKVTASTNATVCILTHTTKADRREENQRRLPIGSVYFENLPRATWEIRAQEPGDGQDLRIGIFPRKQNVARPSPVGLRLAFEREVIVVENAEAEDVLTAQGATQALILQELAHGPVGVSELAEAVGGTRASIAVALSRLKKSGKVDNADRGVWTLAGAHGGEL